MWQDIAAAFALFLILEGLLPFLSPSMWKQSMRKIVEFSDGQLRFIGLAAMLSGLVLLLWAI